MLFLIIFDSLGSLVIQLLSYDAICQLDLLFYQFLFLRLSSLCPVYAVVSLHASSANSEFSLFLLPSYMQCSLCFTNIYVFISTWYSTQPLPLSLIGDSQECYYILIRQSFQICDSKFKVKKFKSVE